MKGKFLNFILLTIFLAGIGVAVYPTVSDWWNSKYASRVIANYAEEVTDMNKEEYAAMWEAAQAFNRRLAEKEYAENLTESELEEYQTLLNVNGTGIMGYVEIEKIGVRVPVYHGTEDAVLQTAAGHMEWTSLPVGGASSHCVIAAHSGLPSAKLFSKLEKLEEKDRFVLYVLDKSLVYEVDQVAVVEPEEIELLQIVKGEDYCTLVTCTPYGMNTHRLLVRGCRVE